MCVCIALCTIVAHNIAQNRPDNFPPYPPDNHHCSDDANLTMSAQLEGTPYQSPSYIRVRAVGLRRGTDKHTVRQMDDHGKYTFRLGYASREM